MTPDLVVMPGCTYTEERCAVCWKGRAYFVQYSRMGGPSWLVCTAPRCITAAGYLSLRAIVGAL